MSEEEPGKGRQAAAEAVKKQLATVGAEPVDLEKAMGLYGELVGRERRYGFRLAFPAATGEGGHTISVNFYLVRRLWGENEIRMGYPDGAATTTIARTDNGEVTTSMTLHRQDVITSSMEVIPAIIEYMTPEGLKSAELNRKKGVAIPRDDIVITMHPIKSEYDEKEVKPVVLEVKRWKMRRIE